MNNAIITIPADDRELVPNTFLSNNNNTPAPTSDNECIIVPPPTKNGTIPKPTSKPINITGNKPEYEAL